MNTKLNANGRSNHPSVRACFGLALLVALIFLTGCNTAVIEARGASEYCEIHHTLMQSTTFPGVNPQNQPTQDYLMARRQYFIHAYPALLPVRVHTEYMIYLCDNCVRVENEWLKAHPASHR